jgi:UDP-3-O-[3-hydroxymyristoyl] glucosamine N-acyltransferase
VVVEADAAVGGECTLHARVTIRERCRVGDRVVIHAGAVIGSDGFGFVEDAGIRNKIPQIGIVEVGDDVEIGANVCVDRAQTGRTVIGRGTKLDNLVQIGHNVRLGENCALSAQTGVSGSCQIGDGVLMGGQVGIADHRNVGDGAMIAAQSGISRDVPAGTVVFGSPARDIADARRIQAALPRLPELVQRVRRLEQAAADGSDADERRERPSRGEES